MNGVLHAVLVLGVLFGALGLWTLVLVLASDHGRT
jgi:hypothetical protein